jgi:hypothetical protein
MKMAAAKQVIATAIVSAHIYERCRRSLSRQGSGGWSDLFSKLRQQPSSPNYVSSLLLVTHKDGSADLYLQDVPMLVEVLAKRDVSAGEAVYQSGIADVRRVKFPNIQLNPDDGVFVCFKVGWKFALFFDLAYDRTLDIDRMKRDLGRLYRLAHARGSADQPKMRPSPEFPDLLHDFFEQ